MLRVARRIPSEPLLNDAPSSALLAAYLEKREDLRRYFALRLGSPEAAEDLVQDIYLRVSRGVEADVASPAAFLYRLGTNLMLDRIKQQRRAQARDAGWRAAHTTSLGAEDVAEEPAADQAAMAREHLRKVIDAANDLSPACRRAFRLHKLEGLSHAETAQAMGISRSAVEKHISAAIRQIAARVGRWP